MNAHLFVSNWANVFIQLGLLKKVSELSTLCGIDACAIVYSPYESQPDVWPDGGAARRVLAQFKRMPEMEQSKKMVNQEMFIRQRIAKAADQLKKLRKENREKEMAQLMYQCLTGKGLQGLGFPELNDLGWVLDQHLKEVYKRIEGLRAATATAEMIVPPQLGVLFGSDEDGSGGDEIIVPPFQDSSHHVSSMWCNVFFP